MKNALKNFLEIVIGSILISLSLLYLLTQYKSLSNLTDLMKQKVIEDNRVFQQQTINESYIDDDELYATIMGYRECPIIIDGNVVPVIGHDYKDYITFIRKGCYEKKYHYDADRKLIMVVYSHVGS